MKIVDRILTALMGLSVIPIALFTPILHWIYQIPLVTLVDQTDAGYTEDFVSLYWLYQRSKNIGLNFSSANLADADERVLALITPLKITVVFFAVAIAIGLAIAVTAVFSNAKKTQMILGACGILSMIGMFVAFKRISAPIESGSVTLGTLLGEWWGGFIASVQLFRLSTAYFLIIIVFIAIIIWSFSYMVTAPKESKLKDIKKR